MPNNIELRTISIHNLLGQEVYSSEKRESSINIANLKKGVYFLRITSDNSSHSKRFIKL